MDTILYLIIPCYNEEEVLPITVELFTKTLESLIQKEKISQESRILFVDDGSKDGTWKLISEYAKNRAYIRGIRLSRNFGQQKALFAGLMEANGAADVVITMDCDGQDDVRALEEMLDTYYDGCDVVYAVRKNRTEDSLFKRKSARMFYRWMSRMKVETVFDHADYRLLSARVLKELECFPETNLFLRGMIPLVGFKSSAVYYERRARAAGKTKYSPVKMFEFALDGITSFSVKPIRMIMSAGCLVACSSFIILIWAMIRALMGNAAAEWVWITSIICFVSGVQLVCLGVIGEYIGKIYMEVKRRPRYIIEGRTD